MNANADKQPGKSADTHSAESQGGETKGGETKGAETGADPHAAGGGEDLRHPKPAAHNDDARSKMPERGDKSRDQSPADRPGKQPGEGEPSVG